MSSDRAVCFVIMPFGKTTDDHTEEYWTKHFTDYLKPLIEETSKVEARRSKPLRGDVVREIIKDLIVSPIVLADLTDSNANVYWELGVRQSFKPGTITIADDGYRHKIPFDIGSKGILFYYPDNAHKDAHFRTDLKNAIQDCLGHPNRPDSAVLETVSGRGTLYEIVHREESVRRLDSLLLELNRNDNVYEETFETATENQRLRKEKKTTATIATKRPTKRFRLVATELVLTHRYLDEAEDFYACAEGYHNIVFGMNQQLNLWDNSPERTELWFLDDETHSTRKRLFDEFRRRMEAARERLRNQL
jgi:hypothetical protein